MSAEIECTPSTRKSHGTVCRPSNSANGSTNPPMQASTWHHAPTLAANSATRGDRVDHALRVLRRRTHHQHRLVVDGGRHRADIGGPVVGHRHRHDRHPEQVRRLVERGVCRRGNDDRAVLDAALCAARSRAASTAHWIDSVPPLVRKPAAVDGPCNRSAVHPTTSFWIEASDGKACVFERVLVQVRGGGAFGDGVDRCSAVVHETERAPVRPARVRRPLGDQIGEYVIDRAAIVRQFHPAIITHAVARAHRV